MHDNTWSLPASLQIQDTAQELQRLRTMFDSRLPVTLDVGSLTAIDTAGVQLLVALVREGNRCHIPVSLLGESAALTRALRLLGLPDDLGGLEGA